MQTGNLVSTLYYAFNTNMSFIYPLISMTLFILFILIILFIRKKISMKNKINYSIFSLICLIVLSIIYLFIPRGVLVENFDISRLTSIFINTLFGVILLHSFTYFNDIIFVPTMMTNNIRMTTSLFFEYNIKKDKVVLKKFILYLLVVFAFIIGVAISFAFLVFKDNLFSISFNNFEFNQNIIYLLVIFLLSINIILYRNIKDNISTDGKYLINE